VNARTSSLDHDAAPPLPPEVRDALAELVAAGLRHRSIEGSACTLCAWSTCHTTPEHADAEMRALRAFVRQRRAERRAQRQATPPESLPGDSHRKTARPTPGSALPKPAAVDDDEATQWRAAGPLYT